MNNLLIVESPNKAKTISQWLDKKEWTVMASNGHIKNLPKQLYSISTEGKHVTAKWEISQDKKNIVENLTFLLLFFEFILLA